MFKRLLATTIMISVSILFPVRLISAGGTPVIVKRPEGKVSCATCPANRQSDQANLAARLGTLGRRTQPSPFTPLKRSLFDGIPVNLVSTATGRLSFAVTDLQVPGAVPLLFQRTYVHDRAEDVGLGVGWSFNFNDQIRINGDAATLTDSAGVVTPFRRQERSQRFVAPADNPGAHQQFEVSGASTITERNEAGLTRTYNKIGDTYRLSQVTGPQAINISIAFDKRGNVTRIANDPGGALHLQWSDEREARLLGVTDSSGARVSFRQDGRRLRGVTDPANAQWTYDYAGGELRRVTDPLGRTMLRVRYDKAGHVTEAGDAAGVNLYSYNFTSASVSQRTVVTDPMGAVTTYEHTESGALAMISEEEGPTGRIEYNNANRPARVSDSLGNEAIYDYDAQNRLQKQSANGSAAREYVYDGAGRVSSISEGTDRTDFTLDARGNPIGSQSSSSAGNFHATYNADGQLSSLSNSSRSISFEYDAAGNETARTYSGAGRLEQEYDRQGRKVAERLPSGLVNSYEYNSRGQVARQSDNTGRSLTLERDASGVLSGLSTPNGGWVRAARDEAGRIIKLSASNGKSRRFAYDARGALTDYMDAGGKHSKFKYDRRGRLQSIAEDNGVSFKYNYDRKGALVSVSRGGRSDNIARKFAHAPQGADYAPWCFGGSDGFTSNLNWTDQGTLGFSSMGGYGSGNSCPNDPFGGFGGSYDGVYGGGLLGGLLFGSGTGENCQTCIGRQQAICRLQKVACIASLVSVGFLASLGCVALAGLTAGISLIWCGAALGGGIGAAAVACEGHYQACLLGVQDKCPSC